MARTVTVMLYAACCQDGSIHAAKRGLRWVSDEEPLTADDCKQLDSFGHLICGPHTVVPLSGVAVVKDRKGRTR